jgi:hypothetical protein
MQKMNINRHVTNHVSLNDYSATEHKMNEENRKNMNVAAIKKALCFTTYSKTNAVNTRKRLDTRHIVKDDRDMNAEQLRRKVGESNNLSHQQQNDLCEVLLKYQPHLTKRPGRRTNFEYEFQVALATDYLVYALAVNERFVIWSVIVINVRFHGDT